MISLTADRKEEPLICSLRCSFLYKFLYDSLCKLIRWSLKKAFDRTLFLASRRPSRIPLEDFSPFVVFKTLKAMNEREEFTVESRHTHDMTDHLWLSMCSPFLCAVTQTERPSKGLSCWTDSCFRFSMMINLFHFILYLTGDESPSCVSATLCFISCVLWYLVLWEPEAIRVLNYSRNNTRKAVIPSNFDSFEVTGDFLKAEWDVDWSSRKIWGFKHTCVQRPRERLTLTFSL